MLLPKLALRNLTRQKRRTLLTGGSMTMGFLLLSVTYAMVEGSYGNIIEAFTGTRTGHIQIHRKTYRKRPALHKTIDGAAALWKKIEGMDGVVHVTGRILAPAMAFAGSKSFGVQILGVDPEAEDRATKLSKRVSKGGYLKKHDLTGVLVSSEFAKVTGAGVGAEVVLLSQGADGSIANGLYTVRGIMGTGSGSLDRFAMYMSQAGAREFLSFYGDRLHELVVLLSHHKLSRSRADAIREAVANPDLDIVPWEVAEKKFFEFMSADKQGSYVTYFIIVFIVAVGILNTVLMSVLERTREFGILKAMGTKPRSIFALIVLETLFLSAISCAIGSVLSVVANLYLGSAGIKFPPVEIGGMIFEKLTTEISPAVFIFPGFLTIGSALLVCLLPAGRAAKLEPVRAMGGRT